mgnify:FL=1
MRKGNVMDFDCSKVTKIYLGADRACRCGCKGEYLAKGEEGFEKRVKRFANMWKKYTPEKDDVYFNHKDEIENINISYGQNRAMTIYFN